MAKVTRVRGGELGRAIGGAMEGAEKGLDFANKLQVAEQRSQIFKQQQAQFEQQQADLRDKRKIAGEVALFRLQSQALQSNDPKAFLDNHAKQIEVAGQNAGIPNAASSVKQLAMEKSPEILEAGRTMGSSLDALYSISTTKNNLSDVDAQIQNMRSAFQTIVENPNLSTEAKAAYKQTLDVALAEASKLRGLFEAREDKNQIAAANRAASANQTTPFETQIMKDLAKSNSEWVKTGRNNALDAVADLSTTLGILESGEDVSGMTAGVLDTLGLDRFLNPRGREAKQGVNKVVQVGLRETLGAQFTEREANMFFSNVYDPSLPEEVIAERVKRLLAFTQRKIEQRDQLYRDAQENRGRIDINQYAIGKDEIAKAVFGEEADASWFKDSKVKGKKEEANAADAPAKMSDITKNILGNLKRGKQ